MDTIANLLTSIRNAELANHAQVSAPFSKQSAAVLSVLKKEGYIANVTETTEGAHKRLSIQLVPNTRHHIKRISTPGRRLYTSADRIPTVLRGLGHVVISTSKGVMTGKEAKKQGLGGELICEVY